MMSRWGKVGWGFFGLCCLAAVAASTLNNGILVGSTIAWRSTRDFQANKIINDPLQTCRYLRASGIVERVTMGEVALPPCRWFGSN